MTELVAMEDLERCFAGVVPAVLATRSGAGVPNVTYLTKVLPVDGDRIAVSNQFFSKTARNLAEHPHASLLLVDPLTYEEYRLTLAYERNDRRGATFDRLRDDVDAVAAITGMGAVFRLRSADIYRVLDIERLPPSSKASSLEPTRGRALGAVALAEVTTRIGRCRDLDALVTSTVDAVVEVLRHPHVHLLLLDHSSATLSTVASRGFDADSVGAEVALGEGLIGLAARRGAPLRVGNLGQMAKYARSIRRSWTDAGGTAQDPMPLPGLPGAQSQIVVPALSSGELVGVVVAESLQQLAFDVEDEAVLSVVASLFASAYAARRAEEREAEPAPTAPSAPTPTPTFGDDGPMVLVRHYDVDGSTFVDGDYLIKGVAGRILWVLLRQHDADGRTTFTNRELRLDPRLELPEVKDNLEARLLLLRRRLDERALPVRIERTGRGTFRLDVRARLRLAAG